DGLGVGPIRFVRVSRGCERPADQLGHRPGGPALRSARFGERTSIASSSMPAKKKKKPAPKKKKTAPKAKAHPKKKKATAAAKKKPAPKKKKAAVAKAKPSQAKAKPAAAAKAKPAAAAKAAAAPGWSEFPPVLAALVKWVNDGRAGEVDFEMYASFNEYKPSD